MVWTAAAPLGLSVSSGSVYRTRFSPFRLGLDGPRYRYYAYESVSLVHVSLQPMCFTSEEFVSCSYFPSVAAKLSPLERNTNSS